jgi:hypothetical protein
VANTAADPYYGYGGVAHHPYGGTSYVQNSPWGLSGAYRYKRSAEAEAGYGSYGYGGIAHHPYGGSSYVQNSPWGLSGQATVDMVMDMDTTVKNY